MQKGLRSVYGTPHLRNHAAHDGCETALKEASTRANPFFTTAKSRANFWPAEII